jgi:ubiquinone/menaquinone biosynthesis C-methylase UbiE
MKQATAFYKGEADKWYRRNMFKPHEPDRVMEVIRGLNIKPRTVLEVGCADGWRLRKIREELGSIGYGIDPSKDAIADAPNSIERQGIKCWRGTAEKLVGVKDHSIDMVIYGFCLYLVDRSDLFSICCECDRALKDNGVVVINDFYSERPYSRVYEHAPELKSYKQDYAALWLGHPHYRRVTQKFYGTETAQPLSRDDTVVVDVLKKDIKGAYPVEEPQ